MNILLTSAGRRSYLVQYFKEALGGEGKVYAGNSELLSAAMQAADQAVVTPKIYDPDYIPFLLEYCKKENITVIISLFDIDLPILAKSKEQFKAAGIEVVVSSCEVIEVCNDKWKTYCFLKEHQIGVPLTFISITEARAAVADGNLVFPVIVKPRWGMGSIGIFQADNLMELEVFYRKCKKEIETSYLKYEAQADAKHCVIIQQMVTGCEYGLDVINDLKGVYQTTIVKRKLAMRSGETDAAVIEDNQELQRLGEALSLKLQHLANLDVDVMISGNNCYIIDLNARFGGGYPYSHMAGVNLPRAIILWAMGQAADQDLLEASVAECFCKDIVMTRIDQGWQDRKNYEKI